MKYTLRDYQKRIINETFDMINKGKKRILIQLSTRGGKSAIASKLTETFQKQGVYFMAHKDILINQMSEEYNNHGIYHSFIKSGRPEMRTNVTIISKDTLRSRFERFKKTGWKDPKIFIIDECHLSEAETFKKIIAAYPDSVFIGLTATPIRLDGKPLGDTWRDLILGPSIKTLQEKKVLCRIRNIVAHSLDSENFKVGSNGEFEETAVLKVVEKSFVIKDVVSRWEKYAQNKKTLTFCTSISHSEKLAKEFNDREYPTVSVTSKDSEEEIYKKLDDYYSGKYINLCSVNLFLMGMTVKECECIVEARPTNSYMIYKQSIGRGMMWTPRKILINLDCCNNYGRHGDPEIDPVWNIFQDNSKFETTVKCCPSCDQNILKKDMVCKYCGHDFTAKESESIPRKINEIDGEMVEIEKSIVNNNYLISMLNRDAKNKDDAVRISKNLGFSEARGLYVWRKVMMKAC